MLNEKLVELAKAAPQAILAWAADGGARELHQYLQVTPGEIRLLQRDEQLMQLWLETDPADSKNARAKKVSGIAHRKNITWRIEPMSERQILNIIKKMNGENDGYKSEDRSKISKFNEAAA